jgi:membrane-bound serine protease (ClpP class)
MMKKNRRSLLFLLFLCLLPAATQPYVNKDGVSPFLIYTFDMNEEIGPGIWRITKKSFEEAKALQANLIIIRMNTYGGMVQYADSLRTLILNSSIPVYSFIDNNAASAGALISIACDRIYMRPGANIGAATVVTAEGAEAPDKYQSYMRSMMRATAQAKGKDTIIDGEDTSFVWKRDPKIAEAMVDERIEIKGITEKGSVLTFTPEEAIAHGFCEGMADALEEVILKAGIVDYEIKKFKLTSMDKVIGFLINPMISGVLIMIIVGGLYFELQSPGVGFPLAAAAIAALLYFAPLYLEGLAEHWEILLFVAGVILLAIEFLVIPGFGFAGIAGIMAIVAGLTLSLVDTNIVFDFRFGGLELLMHSFLLVILSLLMSSVLSIWLSSKLLTSNRFSFLTLKGEQTLDLGYISVDEEVISLKGKEGIAHTVLRPSGKIEVNGELYDAVSQIGWIEKGSPVKVIKVAGSQAYVLKKET